MRYYQKLVSLLVLVLAASFGVGGCVLLYSDFAVQRGRMATANAAAHAQTCTLLQTRSSTCSAAAPPWMTLP